MTQSIRLRCIIGLLGFEPNVSQLYKDNTFDGILEEFLVKISTEEKDMGQTLEQRDPWIPVLAGIVQGKMFCSKDGHDDTAADADAAAAADNRECIYRNRKTDAVLKKSVDSIIQSIMEASNDAVNFRNEAEVALTKGLGGEKDDLEMEKLLDSFHIGSDINPHYVPWCYRLCSEDVVREAITELDDRCDFIVNVNADILQVDERVDRIKAQEEKKEQEEKERMKALAEERKRKMNAVAATAATNGTGSNGGMMSANRVPSSNNNSSTRNGGASTGSNSMAELLMRSKVKSGLSSVTASVDGSSSSRQSLPKTSVVGGGVGGRSRLSGLGRGAAANAIGGRSLANPMSQMRRPMALKGVAGNPGMRRGTATAGTTTAAGTTTTTANKSRTRMKMIDVNEVKGLKKEEEERNKRLTEEEIRENKRRKILEKALAKGLKVKSMGGTKDNVEKGKS